MRFGRQFVALLRPANDYSAADYEALCATLRRQRAAGGPVDKIPVIPVAEVTVNNGVGRVVAARGRCLVVFALEEGIDLVPISYRVVGGDGSTLREIEEQIRKPKAHRREGGISNDRVRCSNSFFWSFGLIVCAPMVLFLLGWGLRWAAMGFRSDEPPPMREPPNLDFSFPASITIAARPLKAQSTLENYSASAPERVSIGRLARARRY